jgi:AbrB family looped-hinge helix DNA binding protein
MEAAKISPKFQVVIPRKLREALKLSPGQKVQMVVCGDRIEMIPLRKLSEMKGFLKGIDTVVGSTTERLHIATVKGDSKDLSRRALEHKHT